MKTKIWVRGVRGSVDRGVAIQACNNLICYLRGPNFNFQHTAICISSSKGSISLFWSPQALPACGAHTYMHTFFLIIKKLTCKSIKDREQSCVRPEAEKRTLEEEQEQAGPF